MIPCSKERWNNNSITGEQVDVDFVSTKGFDLKTLSPSLMDWNFWAVWPPNPTDMGCDLLRQGTPTNAGHVIVFVRMSSILLLFQDFRILQYN